MNKLHEYNGYTNYPTWNVALWIDNDESALNQVLSTVQEMIEDAENDKDEYLYNIEQYLEDLHDEYKIEALNSAYSASVFSDLLGFALKYVNWRELAEQYAEQALENMEL